MADKPKRGLTPEQKAELKHRYEQGEAVASLSRAFKIRRATIAGWITREAWTVQVSVQMNGSEPSRSVQKHAQAKVIDMAAHRAMKHLVESGAIATIAADLSEDLVINARLKLKMGRVLDKLADGVESGELKPSGLPATRDQAQFIKDVMSAYHTYNATLREDLGRLKGTPTVDDETAKKRPKLTRFVIVERDETA